MIRGFFRKLVDKATALVAGAMDEDDDFEGQPWPPVTLSKAARDILARTPEPEEPFREEPPLAGSAKARILRARER